MDALVYCSVKELIQVMIQTGQAGEDGNLYKALKTASQFITRHIGMFLPVNETKTINMSDDNEINIGASLSILSITENGKTITDYDFDPPDRWWRNGPFTHLVRQNNGLWSNKLSISGLWGYYLASISLGINATQAIGDSTLVATNGSVISPGMVLAIESEMESVMAGNGGPDSPAGTVATSRVFGAVASNDELIAVTNGAEFNAGEVITIDAEDIYIQKKAVNIMITIRGWNGTTKAVHADNSQIYIYRTFLVDRGVNGTTAAGHTAMTISRYMPPDDILYLCQQMASLMIQKAETGFSGKAGNANEGEAFFINEFPSQQIEKIKANYWLPWL